VRFQLAKARTRGAVGARRISEPRVGDRRPRRLEQRLTRGVIKSAVTTLTRSYLRTRRPAAVHSWRREFATPGFYDAWRRGGCVYVGGGRL
jgi:hypothetical protein